MKVDTATTHNRKSGKIMLISNSTPAGNSTGVARTCRISRERESPHKEGEPSWRTPGANHPETA